ncbi:trypsin theta [Drosophila tropicalis]|uniref:trypsin theta n=1 Tax=Drosophila tropicalis TaxID=46794 RepID=UPI0035ABCE7A
MHRLLALLVCCLAIGQIGAASVSSPFDPFEHEGRIVGGEDTTIAAHPYQVSLQNKRGSHFCGGSLVSKNIVVTAAHCLQSYKVSNIRVRLGSTLYNEGGIVVEVEALAYHEGYSTSTLEYDVGILKLAQDVEETDDIRYIKLAEVTPANGTPAVVTGWGTKCYFWCMSLPKTLQEVIVYILDWRTCGSDDYKYGPIIYDTMVCAYKKGKDACQGDSGGPLVADDQLVGIVSWGYGCASTLMPGVYADVATLRGWILKTIDSLE